jgi:putative ABC transport system substrate-binding protein
MKRRTFITLIGGAAAAMPLAGRAQQPSRPRRVGVLMSYAEADQESQARVAAFKEELARLGWTEGRNLRIDIVWATANSEKIQRAAQELVALQPDLILSSSTPPTAALLKLTRDIPVVFATVVDPVGSGFVASVPRPGGNATGFTNLEGSIAGKWLELVKEIAPSNSRAAFLYDPATAPFAEIYLDPFKASAASLAVEAVAAPVRETSELDKVITAYAGAPRGGLIVMPGPFMATHSAQIIALAAQQGLPVIYPFRYYAEGGGLMSYGNDQADNYRRAAAYVDRILNGDRPGDLPVQAPVKFELTINLKTAKALGLNVPPRLLQLADAVFE